MDIRLLLVPYDTARRGWRSGAGPEHLLQAGLAAHLESRGHHVADIQVIEADPDQPLAEISTRFELMRRIAVAVGSARAAGQFRWGASERAGEETGRSLPGLRPGAFVAPLRGSHHVHWLDPRSAPSQLFFRSDNRRLLGGRC